MLSAVFVLYSMVECFVISHFSALSYLDQLHFASCSDGQVVTMDRVTGTGCRLILIISLFS